MSTCRPRRPTVRLDQAPPAGPGQPIQTASTSAAPAPAAAGNPAAMIARASSSSAPIGRRPRANGPTSSGAVDRRRDVPVVEDRACGARRHPAGTLRACAGAGHQQVHVRIRRTACRPPACAAVMPAEHRIRRRPPARRSTAVEFHADRAAVRDEHRSVRPAATVPTSPGAGRSCPGQVAQRLLDVLITPSCGAPSAVIACVLGHPEMLASRRALPQALWTSTRSASPCG